MAASSADSVLQYLRVLMATWEGDPTHVNNFVFI
jgi:hypothetical protein